VGKSTDLWIKDEVRAGLFRGTLIDGGCRVLLIDDDTDNLEALKEALVLSGHSVDVAWKTCMMSCS
jgi:hypothetical protein